LNDIATTTDGAIIISNSSVTPSKTKLFFLFLLVKQIRIESVLDIIDQLVLSSPLSKIETPNSKKRHRRAQPSNV